MPRIAIPGPHRFFFYSTDCDERMHVHVRRERLEAKFWLDPVSLAFNDGFSAHELQGIRRRVSRHRDRLSAAWEAHCGP